MLKNSLILLCFILFNTKGFTQDFPIDLDILEIPKPEQIIFEDHIDYSNVKTTIGLVYRNSDTQVYDTLYIRNYNPKGLLEKEIKFLGNQRRTLINNTYDKEQLVKGVWEDLNDHSRTTLDYQYDSEGQLIAFRRKQISQKENALLEDYNMTLSYENGKLIKTSKTIGNATLAHDYWTTYNYRDSLLIEKTSFNGRTNVTNHSMMKYNNFGKIVERNNFIESDYYKTPHLTGSDFYEYNRNGLLVEDSTVLHDSQSTKVTSFIYGQNNRLQQMKEYIKRKGTENHLTSNFQYKNERLIAVNSKLVKNLAYMYWRIPICDKSGREKLGKPISTHITYAYDGKNSRVKAVYTMEDYPSCQVQKTVIVYR